MDENEGMVCQMVNTLTQDSNSVKLCQNVSSTYKTQHSHFCLAESVLFRTSANTGARQESRVPTGSKQVNSPHNDDVKDVPVLLESELIGPLAQYKKIDK